MGFKGDFRHFWNHVYTRSAQAFFADWYAWATRSRLKPMIEKARMLKRHLSRLLSYFRQRITNAAGEDFSSRIQALNSAARGFRNFKHYRTRIFFLFFFCEKLDLLTKS